MQAKSLLLAAALFTLPTGTAFAQMASDQSASMQNSTPAPSTTPGDTTQPSPSATTSATTPASPADVQPNAVVYDATGAKVGTIESVTPAGAVVSTGTARAQIAIASFSKNNQGLVIGMSKSQLEAAVAKAAAAK